MKIFNTLPPSVTFVKNNKAKFVTASRKHHIHIPFTIVEFFFYLQYWFFFCKISDIILQCKFVYLCIYDLFHFLVSLWHTFMDPWHVCMYLCMRYFLLGPCIILVWSPGKSVKLIFWIITISIRLNTTVYKGKAIPLQAWTGPEGSRRLRLPDFKTVGTWRW